MTAVLVTLLVVVVVLLVLAVGEVLHRRPRVSTRRDRLHSDLVGATLDGDAVDLAAVGRTRPTILLFLTTTCAGCGDLWKELAGSRRGLPRTARLLVVTKGEEVEDRARLRRSAPRGLPVVTSTETWARYGVTAAPFVVCVDASGTVISAGPVSGWADVVAMSPAPADVP
jgi:hypothetical protein